MTDNKRLSVSFVIDDASENRRQSVVDQYGRRSSRYGATAAAYAQRRSSVQQSVEPPTDGTLTQSDRKWKSVASRNDDFPEMTTESEAQAKKQSEMGFWQALKTYPTAASWSVLLASTIIMEGYDTSLIGSFFAFEPFAKKYAGQMIDGKYQVPTGWQTGLQNASAVGSMIGLAANGWMCDKFGYKRVMLFALALMTAVIAIPFFAPNVIVLTIGQFMCGIPWGIFQTLAIAYASEVCPTCLRAYLTTYANICWVLGQILASGILKGMLQNTTEWSYRIPFALQWVFPLPIAFGVIFAPESPWWLIRHDRLDEAMDSIRRLQSSSEGEESVANTVSMMRLTNEQEKATSAGTTYWDCFKGTDLRRTEVSCLTWACQNLCGAGLMGYSTYFYEQAGLSPSNAFTFTMIQYVLGFVGTLCAWTLMTRFGRRTLYTGGHAVLMVILLAIGVLGFVHGTAAQWAVGSLLIVFTLAYNCTVGPVCYAIVGEMSSTRLRQKTVVLARITYNLLSLANNAILPLQLNPLAWGWGAKAALYWMGICALCLVWCIFRLPEAKDRSYAELNLLFENKVSAWRFKSTKVDAFRSESLKVTVTDNEEVEKQEA